MFDFVGKRYWFFLLSALVIVPGIISLAIFGLKPGIDFKSGSTMTLSFSTSVTETQLLSTLSTLGYSDAVVQHTSEGNFILRVGSATLATNPDEFQQFLTNLDTDLSTTTTKINLDGISPPWLLRRRVTPSLPFS